MTPKITFEEHFMAPGFERHSEAFLKLIPRDQAEILTRRLGDFDGERIETMDRGNIVRSVLSLTGPGAQGEEPATATEAAQRANDFLAEKVAQRPDRLSGLAALPMHDPEVAAEELHRAVADLGFLGCLVNGHTQGVYYDDPKYDAFWAELQRLNVPFYLHPTNAYATPYVLEGQPVLHGAVWGWGVETGSHALRLLFSGVFDRFPKVKIVLGHMGEALPFLRWRYDSRFGAYPMGTQLELAPSAYFTRNIVMTTSGVCSHAALAGALGEMGEDGVMFSVDYPYEDSDTAVEFIETAPVDAATRRKLCHDNAAALLGLPQLAKSAEGNGMSWHASIPAEEVHAKGAVGVEVDGLRLGLYALDGEIFCNGNICTHAFAILTDGHVVDGCIECPLHQGLFDIRSGKAMGPPVARDIPTYAVKVEDGIVWIDTEARAPVTDATPQRAGVSAAPKDFRRMVIVGAGQAGAETARAARRHGFGGPIVMLGEEAHPPYERPPLSKDLLLGRTRLSDAHVFEADETERLDIDLRLSTRVGGIDREAKQVVLGDGETLAYDMLVLATGASARRIPFEGADRVALHYLRDAGDSERLGTALQRAERVAVIGGGFIGLELASAARSLGKQATVIEAQDRLLKRLLPEEAGHFLAWVAEQNDVALHLGTGVGSVSDRGVMLSDGTLVEADCIIVGVGAVPNDGLAAKAGLATAEAGGIIVNARNQTSDFAIYAVGDVAVARHEISGREARVESWQNAQLSADRAARAISGQVPGADDLPWFWSDLFGGTLQIVGAPAPDLRTVRRDGEAPAFFCLDDENRVVACIDFGDAALLRAARGLIAGAMPVDPAQLSDTNVDLATLEEDEMKMLPIEKRFVWPASGLDRIPDWVYTSQEIYDREVERIFRGKTWNYVGLEAEIPETGDFIRSYVGPTSVVVARDAEGGVNVFENRCAHRAAEFCRKLRGNAEEFVCPYHEWSYDLKGNLAGVPFRRGADGKGGMGPDFRPENHGLRKLNVTTRNGAIFASFRQDVEPFEDYLGEEMLTDFDAVFSGRELKVLGHYRHTLNGNWKLYPENLKDPYHATLLHTFLVTFGLLVAGNKSAMIVDPKGCHSTMASAKSDGAVSEDNKSQMRAYRDGMTLEDTRLMDFHPEFDSPWSVTMQVIWPGLIVQREMNTLGVRQIVPTGPNEFTMIWTMFGYADDDEEMTRHRLRQGNLMGPAGFLGLEDNEAIKFVQDGMLDTEEGAHLVALNPAVPTGTSDTLISESAIRSMYQYWRKEMGL